MKFAELRHWTVGAAHLAVNQFNTEKDPSKALAEAKTHLRKLYGCKPTTAKEMLDSVVAGPKFNDNDTEGIDIFIIKMENIYRMATDINKDATFSTNDTYIAALAKLPEIFARKWAERQTDSNARVLETGDQKFALTFKNFIDFCRRQNNCNSNHKVLTKRSTSAPAARKPQGGQDTKGQPKPKVAAQDVEVEVAATTTSKPHKKTTQSRTSATQPAGAGTKPPALMSQNPQVASSPQTDAKKCHDCQNSNHTLSSCREFRKKRHTEKKEIIMKNGLCFMCFMHGHLASECPKSVVCNKCKGPHNTIFHIDRPLLDVIES